MRLCFATHNLHKLQEAGEILGEEIHIYGLGDIGAADDIPEPYDTLAQNSYEKARYVWEKFSINNFADDSGLEVKALNGAPGAASARFAGPQRSSSDNIDLLLKLMVDKDSEARFATVITLVLDGQFHQFSGYVEGKIIAAPRGNNGFGYDPVFVANGSNKTFAELSADEKNRISHRARALGSLSDFLKNRP